MALAVEETGQCVRNALARSGGRLHVKRWLPGLAGFMVFGCSAVAAHAQTFTLETAIRGALRNDNIALQIQNESVTGAAARVKQAAGQFDWQAQAKGGMQLLYVGKTVNGVVTDQVTTVSSYYYSAGIGREFRNGISIAPGFVGYAGASAALTGGVTQTRPLLGLKVPLLRGLGEDVVDANERAAKDMLASAKLGRSFAIAQLVQSVAQTYWRCVADDQVLQLSQTADKTLSDYQAVLEKMVKRGLMEPNSAKQNAINNVSRYLDTAAAVQTAQQCRRSLAYAMTGSIDAPLPTVLGELPQVMPMADAVSHLNAAVLTQLAYEGRPDLQAAQKNVEATTETLHGAHDATRPDINLQIDPDHAYLSYTQSLENNLAEGQEEAASAANSQAILTVRQLHDQIRADVIDAVEKVQQAASSWTALHNAEQQLEPIIAVSRKSAQFGSLSWQDFANGENQLLSLQQQVVNAQLQFAVALAALRLATGSIEMDTETPTNIALKLASLPAR